MSSDFLEIYERWNRLPILIAVALMLSSCNSEKTGEGGPNGEDVTGLAGIWSATTLELSGEDIPNKKVDFVSMGASALLSINNDGGYVIVYSNPVLNHDEASDAGQLHTIGDNTLFIDRSSVDFTGHFALTGDNILTVTKDDLALGDRTASLRVVFRRGEDDSPPAQVTDLSVSALTSSTVTLTWTAPGDDPNFGTAREYDLRYSTSTINDGSWASATQAVNEPHPRAVGTLETLTVSGLPIGSRYFFALRARDEVVGRWSRLSNVPEVTIPADPPPAAINDLRANSTFNDRVTLTWTAPGADGNTGRATAYDLRYWTSPITEANWASLPSEPLLPRPAGSAEQYTITGLAENTKYYFGLKTRDQFQDNWSSLSNIADATTSLYRARTSPQNVLYDLQLTYRERNCSRYAELLADDFRFFLDHDTQVQLQLPTFWNRLQDSVATCQLFSSNATNIRIDLTPIGQQEWDGTIGHERWSIIDQKDVSLDVDIPGDPQTVTLRVSDQEQRFYFRRGRSPADTLFSPTADLYYLVEWHDMGQGSASAAQSIDVSWTYIKALGR